MVRLKGEHFPPMATMAIMFGNTLIYWLHTTQQPVGAVEQCPVSATVAMFGNTLTCWLYTTVAVVNQFRTGAGPTMTLGEKGKVATLPASCGGAGGTTTSTVTETRYGDYVRAYPDLLASYNASGSGETIRAWGRSHYEAFGKNEGRILQASLPDATSVDSGAGNSDDDESNDDESNVDDSGNATDPCNIWGSFDYGEDDRPCPRFITLDSPNGGEDWKIGQEVTITWTSSHQMYVGGNGIRIELYEGGAFLRQLTVGGNTGSYTWNVEACCGQELVESDYYKIVISAPGESAISDESDAYFSISAP